jgi:hypothetical protein
VTRNLKLVALVFGAGLALLAAACGGSDNSKSTTTPTAKMAPGQDAQAVKDVQAAFQNLSAVKALRAEISAQQVQANGNVAASVFKYDFVPPDRYQLTSSTGGITRVIGDETFAFANNAWTRLADYSGTDYAGFDHFFNPKLMSQLAKEIGGTATVAKGSTDTVNGKSCQMYTLTVISTGNTTEVCIADKYPARLVYHTGKLDTVATFSDINGNVQIDRPPVQ